MSSTEGVSTGADKDNSVGNSVHEAAVTSLDRLFAAVYRRRTRNQKAKQDYLSARGTSHLRLLRSAEQKLSAELWKWQTSLRKAQNKISRLILERDKELKKELLEWLVLERLQEVPGIGDARADAIYRSVFRGRLRDLRNASVVQGVGERTQRKINQWINKYESQLPRLLAGHFPGKDAITRKYESQIKKERRQLPELETRIASLKNQLARSREETDWLSRVRVSDFRKALNDSDLKSELLNHYVRGVFAEWEPMPEWFREAMEAAGVPRVDAEFTPTAGVQIPMSEQSVSGGQPKTESVLASEPATGIVRKKTDGTRSKSIDYGSPLIALSLFIVFLFICAGLIRSSVTVEATPTAALPAGAPLEVEATATPTATNIPEPTGTPEATATALSTRTPSHATAPTTSVMSTPSPQLRVISSSVNLRDGPGVNYESIGYLYEGDIVVAQELSPDEAWYRVLLEDGSEGWAAASVVETINIKATVELGQVEENPIRDLVGTPARTDRD